MSRMAAWLAVVAVLGLALVGCGKPAGPERGLQVLLDEIVRDPARCPTGRSQDLQALLKDAGPDSIVMLPAGCYEIGAPVVVPHGSQLIGAGPNETILFRNPETPVLKGSSILTVFGRSKEAFTRISGLALLGAREPNDTGEDYGIVLNNVRDFRVDHAYFEGFGWAAVKTDGTSRGVVDHTVFVDNYKEGIGNLGYGVAVYGDQKWVDDPQPGGDEAVFVEDNVFLGNRHAIASTGGAHYVFRYNNVRENVVACSVDAHGMGYGQAHGTRYVEVYENVIEEPADRWCGIGIRGGEGVIFGNVIRAFENPILLVLEWGTPALHKADYPARDQIRELWIWENEIEGGPSEPQIDGQALGFIEEGRDYFLEPKPGYEPYPYPHPLATDD